MTAKLLAHTISINGPDALAFAHAQFSSHVDSLAVGQWQFSAWLDPRGRVRALFHLARCGEDALFLLLRGGDAPAIAEALRRFVFRSRVSIAAAAGSRLRGGPALPLHSIRCGPDGLVLGCGGHSLQAGTEEGADAGDPGDDEDLDDMCWRVQQLRAGWPWLPDTALDRWLAPDLSLQRLRAVVTDKGCYPGQEIVARMHFRGVHKHHLCNVVSTARLQAGEPLRVAGRDAGCILEAIAADAGFEALAVLGDETVNDIINGRLDVHNEKTSIRLQQIWPA